MDLRGCSVSQSNYLIRASYRLTLSEQRVLLCCLAQIDARKRMQNLHSLEMQTEGLTVTALEYAELFELDPSTAYRELQQAADRLYERTITVRKNEKGEKTRQRWLQGDARAPKGSGYIRLSFTMALAEHLCQLKGKFTTYQLESIRHLKRPNAIRMFQLMMQWKETQVVRVKIDELRQMLDICYPNYADAKRYVIKPAMDEINALTDYSVTWREIKAGRKIDTLEIRFSRKAQQSLPVDGGPLFPDLGFSDD